MITSCRIKKIPNMAGNYSCQYVEDHKLKVCSFKTYEDAIITATMNWNLWKEIHLDNSVILKREEDEN